MIDHPLLSFKDLSDDELLEKTADLHRRLAKASMWGSGRDLITQMEWMLEMIEQEKAERYARQAFDALSAVFPETVESDPDFVKTKVEVQDSTAKVVKPAMSKKVSTLPAPVFNKEYTSKDQK